jgi:hypothetical protein
MRTLGGLLQLFGVSTVAYGLMPQSHATGPSPTSWSTWSSGCGGVKSWIVRQYRRWRGVSAGATVTVQPASVRVGISSPEVTVTAGPRTHDCFDSDSERVAYLFKRLEGAFFRPEKTGTRITEAAERVVSDTRS